MKKFSLKKITAAVSAAAMIATMGTSAFASEITVTNDTITISDTDGDGIFDITVNYTSTVNNEIGVTMLTYGMSDDSDIAASTGYATTGMKIVGVDQSAGAVAKDGTGSFNFKVSAIKNSNGGYYLKRGVDAIIAVSGDGVPTGSTPTYNTIKLPALPATSATFGSTDSVSVDYYSYEDVKTKIAPALAAAHKTAAVTAANVKNDETLESYAATYTFDGNETVEEGTGENAGKYYVTIPAGATLAGDDASCITVGEGLKDEVPVTLNRVAWVGDSLALANGLTGITITKAKVTDAGNINDAVKAALADKLVITKEGVDPVSVTNASAENVINVSTTDAYNSDATADQTLTYKVTANGAKATDATGDIATYTSPEGTSLSITVTVKNLADGEFIIDSVKALKNDVEVTIPDQNFGAELQSVLNTALADAHIWVYGTNVNTEKEEWSLATGEWTISGYDVNVETEQTVTAKKAIVAPENNKGKNDNNKELSFTFKVLAKPTGPDMTEWKKGDINKDGLITIADWGILANHVKGGTQIDATDERAIRSADVNNDGVVTIADWGVLANHVKGGTQITQIDHDDWK